MWPQITILVLYGIILTIHSIKHGESNGNYSAFVTMGGIALNAFILYSGGFFNLLIK